MWNLLVTALNVFTVPTLSPELTTVSSAKLTPLNKSSKSEIAQTSTPQPFTPVEAVSPQGYSLKHPASWQKFATQTSDPNSDIFIGKSFTEPAPGFTVVITTTIRQFLSVPSKLPPNVKKFDAVAELYTAILAKSGYRVSDIKSIMVNGRKGYRLVTQKPENQGSITVLIEGEDEKMIVSTASYPTDSSIMSRELLGKIVTDIDAIQNSITVR